jgi:hypothetical protein
MALRAVIRATAKVVIIAGSLFSIFTAGVTFSDDPLSAALRPRIEVTINGLLDSMMNRAATCKFNVLDRILLHAGIMGGIVIGQFISPEGAEILRHAVYGDGTDLRLDPAYLQHNKVVAMEIEKRGLGHHGPIWVPQSRDWRLSLAFNPVFITVSDRSVRVGHPRIQFAAPDAPPVPTIIPVGKLRLRVFDNLVGALQSKSFAAYAEWRLSSSHE